ncbi:NERD domain-containing protein [Neobacillus cucumis]|uniref:nuclease-related domain-containing protein n=1 Tax=Neobacillus cucumis TaxID=1740721 RepID=UPI0018DF62F3|nr:nuclease-related domain-containing protein [Neobacillus cucumis]MBI0579256.1 NERD domain-containing protein [Neobacillus cucumis]
MFEKDLFKPILLAQHEALERRTAKNHPSRQDIEEKLTNLRSGYRGEKSLHYYLSLLPPKRYHIFHDIRLQHGDSYFQIDAFLHTEKSGLIIDSKNYSGSLLLERHQLTQEVNENKRVYSNPLSQVARHKILLNYFFEKNQLPIIPLDHLVCFTNSKATLHITPGYMEAEKKVCRAENLLMKIAEYEKFFKKDCLDPKQMGKIKKQILNKQTPLQSDVLQMYNICPRELILGVLCPKCLHLPMHYKGRKWRCPGCNAISIDAHLFALNDFFLLIKPCITIAELCWFLQLPSPRAAAYLFSILNFPHSGTNKGRIYHQPKTFL